MIYLSNNIKISRSYLGTKLSWGINIFVNKFRYYISQNWSRYNDKWYVWQANPKCISYQIPFESMKQAIQFALSQDNLTFKKDVPIGYQFSLF